MILHRLTLRNFKGTTCRTVEFAPGVTVLQGRNEAGKSTLMEALRFLRLHKATSRKADIRAAQPVGRDIGPEVEVELSTGPYHLTYRKRWLRSPEAELRVLEPKPEQLAGDEAHERFLGIVAETTDEGLFEALEIVQGASLGQAELAQLPALRRALDTAETSPEGHQDLLESVEAEYLRYFTPKGRPTGEYRSGAEEVESLREQVEALEQRSWEIDQLAEQHDRVSAELNSIQERRSEVLKELGELEAADHELDVLRAAKEQARAALEEAETLLTQARRRLDDRRELHESIASSARQCREAEDLAQEAAARERQAHQLLGEAASALTEAETERTDVRQTLNEIEGKLRRAREISEARELRDVLERIESQEQRLAEARKVIEAVAVDDAALANLEELEVERRLAHESWLGGAAKIELTVLGEVLLDGEALPPGDHGPMPVEDMVLEAPGQLRIRLTAGTEAQDAEARARRAGEALTQALEKLGVSGLAEARLAVSRAAEALSSAKIAREMLDHLLAGQTKAELEARAELLPAESETEQPDETELGARLMELQTQWVEIDQRLAQLRDDVTMARHQQETAKEEWIRADAQAVSRRSHLKEAEQRLQRAIGEAADSELCNAVSAAEKQVAERRSAVEDATGRLAAADAELLHLRVENHRSLSGRLLEEQQQVRDELMRLSALLTDRLAEGAYDRLHEARAHMEATEARQASLTRAALAVQRLRDVLLRHRSEAQLRYVGPFRERMEALGRLIYGPGVSLEVAPELNLASRTLDGVTVPFESLSTGAREQLSLLGRLACAQLVQPGEGVPLIIDDALGFSDPERLSRLGAVLNQAGESGQIIILTCQPDRFRNIGGAQVVRI